MQSWKHFELIVIDGASSDGSQELVSQYGEVVRHFISEPDNGIYHAMNKGWKMATQPYCLFLNAGDHLHNEYVLEKVAQHISGSTADFFYGNMIGHKNGNSELNVFDKPVSLYYLYHWYLPHPASFIKKSLLAELNGYYEHYRVISDWAFMIKALLVNSAFEHMPFTVSEFYADGISSGIAGGSEKEAIMKHEFRFLKNDFDNFRKFRNLEQSRLVKLAVRLQQQLR